MDPGKLIDSLIGKRPRVFMFFGDTVTPGIVEPFYDPDRRSELGVSEENSHSLAGLGLDLEQQKTLAPGLYPHLILRTTELFAERDFTARMLMDKEFAIGGNGMGARARLHQPADQPTDGKEGLREDKEAVYRRLVHVSLYGQRRLGILFPGPPRRPVRLRPFFTRTRGEPSRDRHRLIVSLPAYRQAGRFGPPLTRPRSCVLSGAGCFLEENLDHLCSLMGCG
jgi:hypothetical protein